MKNVFTANRFFTFILFMSFAVQVNAESNIIKEISSADLGELARENSSDNKQTMVIYYKDNCAWCDQLASTQSSVIGDGFRIYKTNTSAGFDVICPNGEYLSDNEFLKIKGIMRMPAAVITDNSGNVIHVENAISDSKQLATLIHQHKKRIVAKQ